jgi:hypothetical protein
MDRLIATLSKESSSSLVNLGDFYILISLLFKTDSS